MPFPAFPLKRTIGLSHVLDPDDVFRAKSALAQLGHYEAPDYGLDPWPDRGLIDSLKSFQRRHGLAVDGIMNPDGPTAAALGAALGHGGLASGEWDWRRDRPRASSATFAAKVPRPVRPPGATIPVPENAAWRPARSELSDSAGDDGDVARDMLAQAAAKANPREKIGGFVERGASPPAVGGIAPEFLDAIARREQNRETGGLSYDPVPDPNAARRTSELGKYQINRSGFQDIGWQDKDGNWTAEAKRHGVGSDEDFRKTPAAQEAAIRKYFARKEQSLENVDAFEDLGQEIEGLKARFPITEAGLLSAAHRQGEGVVALYLDHQKANGWKSDFSNIGDKIVARLKAYDSAADPADKFRSVETWLRKHHALPYRR